MNEKTIQSFLKISDDKEFYKKLKEETDKLNIQIKDLDSRIIKRLNKPKMKNISIERPIQLKKKK